MKPWTRNINPSWRILLGIFSTSLLNERLWNQNGFIEFKIHYDGTIFHYKACLVASGQTQCYSIDNDKNLFSYYSTWIHLSNIWIGYLHMTWISFNMTSKCHFCLVSYLKKLSWGNFKVIANLRNNNLFVIFTKTFMGFVRLFNNGT